MNNLIKIDIIRARVLLSKKKSGIGSRHDNDYIRLFNKYGDKILDLVEAADSKRDLAPFLFDENQYLRSAAKLLLTEMKDSKIN